MTEFFTLTFIGLLMIISPGPDFAIVTKTSLNKGRNAGLGTAFGIALANLCHVMLNLLGIGMIIASSAIAFTIMKVFGAAYLLYIGYKGLRAKPADFTMSTSSSLDKNTQNTALGLKGFYSGFMTSILNPKACLFYLSFFSVILSPTTPLGTQILYGSWLSALALVWFMLVALFFTHPFIGEKLKDGKHWIERVAGGALVLLGIRLLTTKASV